MNHRRIWLACAAAVAALAPAFLSATSAQTKPTPGNVKIAWKKTVVDTAFRSEGVGVADVNKDGKLDIIIGDVWYEAPNWKMHIIRKDRKFDIKNYSESFCCFPGDFNGDGWVDVIVIPFPGQPCYWYENPQNKPGPWKGHLLATSACNETPLYVDLLGKGEKVLVMGWQPKGKDNEGQMAYFKPGKDPTQLWEIHPISEPSKPGKDMPGTRRFSHGLGVGDVNGDGRPDVICTGAWWEQPEKVDGKPWKFHPAKIGTDCSDMYAFDVDGDGKNDIISASAHGKGIWWHHQRKAADGATVFATQTFFKDLVPETHALHFVDIDGDGLKDLVTGRRWWSHAPANVDPKTDRPSNLFWFKATKKSDGSTAFVPNLIDDASGVGTQFALVDLNGDGLPDVIISNKLGVFIFEQVRTKED